MRQLLRINSRAALSGLLLLLVCERNRLPCRVVVDLILRRALVAWNKALALDAILFYVLGDVACNVQLVPSDQLQDVVADDNADNGATTAAQMFRPYAPPSRPIMEHPKSEHPATVTWNTKSATFFGRRTTQDPPNVDGQNPRGCKLRGQ